MSYHSSQHQAAGGTPTDARRDKRDTNLSPFEFVRGCERVGNRVYCISMREARGAEATREVVWWDRTRAVNITRAEYITITITITNQPNGVHMYRNFSNTLDSRLDWNRWMLWEEAKPFA